MKIANETEEMSRQNGCNKEINRRETWAQVLHTKDDNQGRMRLSRTRVRLDICTYAVNKGSS